MSYAVFLDSIAAAYFGTSGTTLLFSIIIGVIVFIALWLRHPPQRDVPQAVQSSNDSDYCDQSHQKIFKKRGGGRQQDKGKELSNLKTATSRVPEPIPTADSDPVTPPEATVPPPCITPNHAPSMPAVASPPIAQSLSSPASTVTASAQASAVPPPPSSAATSAADDRQKFILILADLLKRTESPDFKTDFEVALSGSSPDDWVRMNSMRGSAELAAFQSQGYTDSDSCNKLRKKYAKQKADADMVEALQHTEWLYDKVNDWAKAHKAAVALSSSTSSTPTQPSPTPSVAGGGASLLNAASFKSQPSAQSLQADASPLVVVTAPPTSQFRVTVTEDAATSQTGSLLCPVLVVKGQLCKNALIRNSDGARAVVKGMVDASKQKVDVALEGMRVSASLGKVVESKDQKGDGCVTLDASMLKRNTELRSVKSLPEQGHCLWYKVITCCDAFTCSHTSNNLYSGPAAAVTRPCGHASRCGGQNAPSSRRSHQNLH